jgi:hypothetical protein
LNCLQNLCSRDFWPAFPEKPVADRAPRGPHPNQPQPLPPTPQQEREFVVETRATGVEHETVGATESLGVTERVTGTTPPGPVCP